MIQPQPAQRGTIGEHHGLTRLTTTLEALEAGQRKQETRDTQIQAQLTTQATALAQLVRWGRYQLSARASLGLADLAPTARRVCPSPRQHRCHAGAAVGKFAETRARIAHPHLWP